MNKNYFWLALLVAVSAFSVASYAHAAVVGTSTAMTSNAANTIRANTQAAVLMLNLSNSSSETLGSVTIIIATTTSATSTALATSSFTFVGVAKDAGGNVMLATTTVRGIATSTTINVIAATTTPANGNFFVILGTAGTSTFTDNGWPENGSAVPQKFVATISTSTGVVASTTASLTGATTTAPFVADIHSQAPNVNKISANYNSSGGTYSIFDTGGLGGVGELGTLNVYSTSTPGAAPVATSSVNSIGSFNVSLGTTYYPSVWLDANDVAGNATSSRVQYNLSANTPTVTSFSAFTDRVIMNVSKSLRGDQASNCSNYLVNGSAPSCNGGPGSPYVNFSGNQVVIQNLILSGTVSFSVNGLIQDTASDQFPLSFSTSSVPVVAASVPTISSISPNSGIAGNSVTITGTSFGTATGTVFWSGGFDPSTGPKPPVQASTTAWSDTSITATVPAGAQSGPLQIVSSAGMPSNVGQNTFFNVLGNAYIELALVATSTPVTTSTNMKIFIGGPAGEQVYYAGDASSTTFSTSTYIYTLPNISSNGFVWAYDASGAYLPAPGTNLQSGTSSSSPQFLVFATSTPYNVSGTITLGTSCTNSLKNQNVAVMAIPQGQTVQMGPGGVQPSFFTTNNSCQTPYALALPATSTYNVQAQLPPSTSVTGLLAPASQTAVITTSTPTVGLNFTFTSASQSIYGQVVGGDGNPLSSDKYNNLWVFGYQPIAGGTGSASRPDSNGYFRIYANTGAYKLSVGGPEMPMGVEQNVLVTTSTTFAATSSVPVVTIKLAPPTSYIDGYVKDGSANAISGADVFSYCSNGPGGGHGTTDSQGYYKMFVPPCSNYHVNGFSSTYGQFTEQTGVTVANSGSATVSFTISSSNFVTVSGTVSQNSAAVSGANVWITQGNFGPGVAGGQTDATGAFSLKVKSGLSNLYVHAAVAGQGELANQQLASGGTVSSNQTGISLSSSVATLTINLKPGNTFSQVFLGAHSGSGGGFTNTATATSTDHDTYQIQVPYAGGGTSYTIDGGIPNFGPVPATTTTVTGNATISIDLSSISYYTVSGSVSGDYSSAFVWAGGSSGGGGTQVNSSTGAFSMQLRQGTYDIGVNKPGYIGSLLSSQNIATTTTGLSLSLTQSTSTISGTVYYNISAVSGVRIWADNSSGGWSGGQTDANGAFSLSVTPGAWRIHAVSDGYQLSAPLLVTAPVSGLSVNLSAVSFTPTQQLQSISPSAGGIVQTTSTKVQIPQGALGSGSTNVQLSVTDTMSTPAKKGANVIGTGENISASYASGANQGQAITTLSSNATLQFVLTKAQLVAGGITSLAQVNNMQIGYDDTTSNSWTYIQTTVTASSSDGTWNNLQSVTLSGTTSHFSTYAPVSPTNGSAPATPRVAASAGNGQITISWSSVSGATKYDVYKQGGSNYVYLAQTAGTSYTDTGLTNGTTYYYEISALDDSNNESAASDAVSATPSVPTSGGGGGGGGGGTGYYMTYYTTTTMSTTAATTTTVTTPATLPTAATPTLSQAANAIFNAALRLGAKGKDVTRLQKLLAQDSEVYPEGKVTGYFGPLTEKAVQRFQKKYGIVSSGNPATTGYGVLGPKTRAKLAEVFGGTAVQPQTPSSAIPATTQELKAKIQELQQQLLQLLQQLIQLLKAKTGA